MNKRSIINSIYSNNHNLSNSKYTYILFRLNPQSFSRNFIKRRVIINLFVISNSFVMN